MTDFVALRARLQSRIQKPTHKRKRRVQIIGGDHLRAKELVSDGSKRCAEDLTGDKVAELLNATRISKC